jgi:antitoxin HicB
MYPKRKNYSEINKISLIKISKEAKRYLNLSYSYTVETHNKDDEEEYFVIKVNELPGCMSHGKTIDEAFDNIKDAMLGWISVALESGNKIPTPENFSGKFSIRIPPTLHKELVIRANKEGVSLNQLATTAFAKLIGYRPA